MPITTVNSMLIGVHGVEEVQESVYLPPVSGPFAGAYSDDGKGGDALDMAAARDIYRGLVRSARDMTAADIAVNKAADSGNATAEAAARSARQALRDLTAVKGIDKAKSLEDLRALWPVDLLGACPF